MLQFYVELCCIESNVAYRVRHYIHLFVALELVSDVLRFILGRTHTGQYDSNSQGCTLKGRFLELRVQRDKTLDRPSFPKPRCR